MTHACTQVPEAGKGNVGPATVANWPRLHTNWVAAGWTSLTQVTGSCERGVDTYVCNTMQVQLTV